MRLIILLFLLGTTLGMHSQVTRLSNFYDNWLKIDSVLYSEAINPNDLKTSLVIGKTISAHNYFKKHQLEFTVFNNKTTTDSVYFFLGHWIDFTAEIKTSSISKKVAIEYKNLHVLLQNVPLIKVVLAPNQSLTYIIYPKITNFNFHYINPFLVKQNAINDFAYSYFLEHQKIYLILSFVFMGLMIGMFLYAIISWFKVKSNDYLYYGIYVLFFIFYFLLRILFLFVTDYAYLQHAYYAVHFVQIMGYILYAFFIIAFLHLGKNDFLYKLLRWFCFVLSIYLLVDAYLIYFSNYISISIRLFVIIRYFLLAVSIVTVVYLFRLKNRVTNYLAWGIAMLFLFGTISLFFSNTDFVFSKYNNFFDMRIPIYQMGIAIELVLFTMALQYKNNLKNKESIREMESLKIENEKKEFETFMAVMKAKDNERTRIAQEIHDDIGSGLTSIRLLSEIAKAKNKETNLVEMEKISTSASELIENMNEIIWSINSKNDNLSNLIAYLRRYVVTYFESMESITVKTVVPVVIPDVLISGDFRRSIFLVVKESLHNIIKHAIASKVLLQIDIREGNLEIKLTDNGKGFEAAKVNAFSNGLKNMRDRIEGLGGNFSINSFDGTSIWINLPLNN